MEERREDLEAGEGSLELLLPGMEASKGESERCRCEASGPRLRDVWAGDVGRDMGAKEGSDLARMRPRRPDLL